MGMRSFLSRKGVPQKREGVNEPFASFFLVRRIFFSRKKTQN